MAASKTRELQTEIDRLRAALANARINTLAEVLASVAASWLAHLNAYDSATLEVARLRKAECDAVRAVVDDVLRMVNEAKGGV